MRAASIQTPDRNPFCAPPLRSTAACSLLVLALSLTATGAAAYGSSAATGGGSGPWHLLKPAGSNATATTAGTASAAERTPPPGNFRRRKPGLPPGEPCGGQPWFPDGASCATADTSRPCCSPPPPPASRGPASRRRATSIAPMLPNARPRQGAATPGCSCSSPRRRFAALDAYVDAHLADFGVSLAGSPDLSLTWRFQ